MKRLMTTLFVTLTLASCGSAMASAQPVQLNIDTQSEQKPEAEDFFKVDGIPQSLKSLEVVILENKAKAALATYKVKMTSAVGKLKKYVGWDYGFGETPGAWDCSGLVRWFYKQIGVDVYHSATVQSNSGRKVTKPIVGDIVAFHYYGSFNDSFHTGIYIGNGKVLHAYNSRVGTVITTVKEVEEGNNAYATFTRIVEVPKVAIS